jgi:hypothetical protein
MRIGVSLTTIAAVACSATAPDKQVPLPPPPGLGPLVVVEIGPDGRTVAVGDTLRIRVTGVNGLPPERVDWAVSDTLLATVDIGGLVTGRRVGDVGVRATAYRGTAAGYGVVAVHIR